MRPLHRTALQVALVLGFLPLSDRQPWLPPVTAEERSPLPNVPGITADWWSGVQSTLVAQEYAPSVADFGLQAPNRAQSFRSSFLADRITLGPRVVRTGQDWKFTWRTRRWGRAGAMQRLAPPATPAAAGARVRYERPDLAEWYENRKDGLEQGFTIAERLNGTTPIAIEGEISGGLRPRLDPDRKGASWVDGHGECVLRYGGLRVWDAAGRELPSWLALAEGGVALCMDDRDARYPITVDPILTTPSWTVESNQANCQFGAYAATAGDVNGDGFSDVIVGASGYDNGQTDEGRVFVFHGSATGMSTTAAWTAESNQASARLGPATTAGDVNGDGFSDVIVSSSSFDNGQTDEGRVFVYHGSAAGLGATPAWTAESNQASAAFGVSIGTAGDVNGDGFSDVIVGAYLFDNDQGDEGRAFVYHGSAAGLAATPAWTAESNQAQSSFGSSAGTAGDVNADGYSDVLVGAPLYDNDQANEGRVFVYLGSATGLASTPAATVEGNQPLASYGQAAAGAGDVNGDGYADIIVGAPRFTNGESLEGRTFVYRGYRFGLLPTPWTSEANEMNAQWGFSVATAGDVNADGLADIIIGAPFSSNGQTGEGLAAISRGTPDGPTPLWATWSDQANSRYGISVGTAGDVNGDGLSDVLVGSDFFDNGQTDEGRVFLFHGSAYGLGDLAWTADSNEGQSLFGRVASAGDVNGDGYSDVIIGAPGYDHGELGEGMVFVYFGSQGGLSTLPGWSEESNTVLAQLGASVSTAGDVNGDGYSDIAIGAYFYTLSSLLGGPGNGKAYVYHGSAKGLGNSPSWTAETDSVGTELGVPVATAGDVNGDGFSDLLVSAARFNAASEGGRVFLYEGSPAGLQELPAWFATANQTNANFGAAAASAGDVNGDGYSDVAIGAPYFDNGQIDEGRVSLFRGSAFGLEQNPTWTFESNLAQSFTGFDVASARDVNGDGFSDLLVGAPFYSNGESAEGRAYLFAGSATGLSSAPDWMVESDQAFAHLGRSLSSAGDVNADGYSDVLIGAPLYTDQFSDEGQVQLFYGSASGLAPASTWAAYGRQNGAALGSEVDPAGDVNGDGFSDVVVAAPNFDNGQTDEGAVFVYYGNDGQQARRTPQQMQSDGSAPIDLLGRSRAVNSFRLAAIGRTPAGRGKVRLEAEVKPAGTPFDGQGLLLGPLTDTGPVVVIESAVPLTILANGLAPGTLYHWRLRVRSNSPFFPRSVWISMPGNALTEADMRTADVIGIAEAETAPRAGSLLGPVAPNPFSSATRVSYQLPAAGPHRLGVYDVQGRLIRILAAGARPAGHQETSWNGRDAHGAPIPAGVYFLRLEVGSRSETAKVVLAPGGR